MDAAGRGLKGSLCSMMRAEPPSRQRCARSARRFPRAEPRGRRPRFPRKWRRPARRHGNDGSTEAKNASMSIWMILRCRVGLSETCPFGSSVVLLALSR
jgi:hypothetical protein